MTEGLDQGLSTDELQAELRDLLSLAVVGNHVRWVLIGDGAAEFRQWLIDAVAQWHDLADEVAKHLVTLGVAPDGRVRSMAKDIPLNWVPDGWLRTDAARLLIAERLRDLAEWARYRRSQAVDPETVRLFNTVCLTLEHSITNARLRRTSVGST
jgi:starvation-inducible DNA-binding protein